MKKIVLITILLLLVSSPAVAAGGLNAFLNDLNIQARADMNGFSAKVSAQFGIPLPEVQAVIKMIVRPVDAFLCFQLGEMSNKNYDTVTQVISSQGERQSQIAPTTSCVNKR